MYRIKKAAAAISGWDHPLLTLIYLGFDCAHLKPFETPQIGPFGKTLTPIARTFPGTLEDLFMASFLALAAS